MGQPRWVYVGYWFWGRPSNDQLWADIAELLARTKRDFGVAGVAVDGCCGCLTRDRGWSRGR